MTVALPDDVADLASAEAGLAGADWVSSPIPADDGTQRPMDDMGFDSPPVPAREIRTVSL